MENTGTTPSPKVLRTVNDDRREFVALVEDYKAWGLPLPRYSRMLMLSRRIARRTNSDRTAVLASVGL